MSSILMYRSRVADGKAKSKVQRWRWRFVHSNGNIMANSTEAYADKRDCENAIQTLKVEFPGAEVMEL